MIVLAAALMAAAPAAGCSPERAVRTTIAAIGENPDVYLGRCVTLSGPAGSIVLYSSVEGLYLSHRLRPDGNPDPRAVRRHRIGVYSEDSAIRALRPRSMPWLTVTGTVDSCRRKRDRAAARSGPDTIIMMTGYCHYHGGAVLDAVAVSVDPARTPHRLAGERARRRYGDLVAAPDDWPHLATMRAIGAEFAAAVRRRDREKLASLHEMAGAPDEHDTALLDALVGRPDSPFAEMRGDESRPMAIFVRRHEVALARAGRPPEEPFGTICFCRSGDCRGRWPISGNDADNDPARPYACTGIVWKDWARRRIGLDTPLSRGGWLAEPARPD